MGLHMHKTSSGLLITSDRLDRGTQGPQDLMWAPLQRTHAYKSVRVLASVHMLDEKVICFSSLSPLHLSYPRWLILLSSFPEIFSELINAWRWPYYYHTCRPHICDSILITSRMKTLKDLLFPSAVECIKHPPPSTIPTRAFCTQTFAAFAQSALITEDTKTSCRGSELSSSRAKQSMQDSFWSAIRP